MQLDPKAIGTEAMYKLMIGCVVPRPIAWVSSVDASGVPNLAPFSYFMAITHDPPTIAFSASPRAEAGGGRGKKDTLRNVEATREFVVNMVDDALAEQMNVTSGRLRAGYRRIRAGLFAEVRQLLLQDCSHRGTQPQYDGRRQSA